MQQKHTSLSCWHLKPVRPVSKIGQTTSVGLSLSTDRGNRSDRFCPEPPQNTLETRTAPKCLKNLSSFKQEKPKHERDLPAQKPFTTAHMAKPVKPVWETGQASFAWTVRKNTARGKNSAFQAIDLPMFHKSK
jgi:hypothetical protein